MAKLGPKGNFGFRRWVRKTATETAMAAMSTAGTVYADLNFNGSTSKFLYFRIYRLYIWL